MKKILLIDDDSAIHLITSAALAGAGAFKLGFARTGRQGLARAASLRPDLVLLDHMLPDIDGEQVLARMRADAGLSDTPVIFLTAKGDDPSFDPERLGAQGLVSKPFDPDQLAAEIRHVLALPEEAGGPVPGGLVAAAFPAGGSLDQLRRSFVERGCKEVERLIDTLGPKFDIDAARRIAHLWVGRGGTLGHPRVSVVARRLELRLAEGLAPENRWRLESDLRAVQKAFREAVDQELRGRGARDAGGHSGGAEPSFAEASGTDTTCAAAPGPALRVVETGEEGASSDPTLQTVLGPDVQPAEQAVSRVPIEASLPSEFRELMAGRTVVLFGFEQCDTEAMREVLQPTGMILRTADTSVRVTRREDLRDVDVAVIDVAIGCELAWDQVSNLQGVGIPCLVIGPSHEMLAPAIRAGRCEFLLRPWCAEEVLLRTYRLLAGAESSPAPRQTAENELQPDTVKDSRSSGSLSVVVADDDPTITALVEMTLRQVGITCHVATGGEDALALIRELRPRAAVLDVNMPQMDGFEVLSRVRNDPDLGRLPVLMLTALRQEADVIRGFRLGADDYVVKPFNPMELSARLERLVGP